MQPDVEVRLRAMSKALQEVVLPAIDPHNKAAIEQASLVLGSLALLNEQLDYAHWYATTDTGLLCQLVEALDAYWPRDVADRLAIAVADAQRAAARHATPLSTITAANRALRDGLCDALDEALSTSATATRTQIERTVVQHSAVQLQMERAFVAKTGFDVSPQTLLPLAQALAAATP